MDRNFFKSCIAKLALSAGEDVGRAAGPARVLVPLASVDPGDRSVSSGYGGTRAGYHGPPSLPREVRTTGAHLARPPSLDPTLPCRAVT